MQRAEKDLDITWEKFNKQVKQGVRPSTYSQLAEGIPQHSLLQRTPDQVRSDRSQGRNRKLYMSLVLAIVRGRCYGKMKTQTKQKTKGSSAGMNDLRLSKVCV
jgi:hypothetical protein